jgi:glyoxylase-like metal-dependent hydrolase (beta-lactamase superfamily II)
MTHDGIVVPDGPAQTFTTSALEISKMSVGPMDNNAYLLRNRTTGETLLIDAANDADRLLTMCGGRLDKVLTTHCHADHWLALEAVVAATGATTYAAQPEISEIPIPTDVSLSDGDIIELGEVRLEVCWLTGHRAAYLDHVSTSAAVVYRDKDGSNHVFAGDCLFPGGIGNTCEDPGAFTVLLNDVASKLFARLPDDTRVYPGHGGDTTLGAERPHLGEWASRHW